MPAVRTSLSKKRKECEALASRIERTGFEMFPCSGCDKNNLKCVVSEKENSRRCSECVRRGTSCDVKASLASRWRALEMEEDRLERESETALRLAEENLARHKRLEKQKKFLKSKGKEMLRRGLKTLDELEEVEERERQMETERAAAEAAATQIHGQAAAADPFAGIEIPLLPPEVWAN